MLVPRVKGETTAGTVRRFLDEVAPLVTAFRD